MVSCGNLLKSVLVAVVLATLAASESTESKLKSCCEEVSSVEITEPIIGYHLQRRNPPCVPAVIFQTEKGSFCAYVGAPWVRAKVNELRYVSCSRTLQADLSTLHTLACLLTCRIIFSPNSLCFHSF
uniref:Chemokine interleukin-8-like domain-containing protein n=1 Tax=Myripristis murdjan TaxID=586833 RepID=A0A667Z897_9TELE